MFSAGGFCFRPRLRADTECRAPSKERLWRAFRPAVTGILLRIATIIKLCCRSFLQAHELAHDAARGLSSWDYPDDADGSDQGARDSLATYRDITQHCRMERQKCPAAHPTLSRRSEYVEKYKQWAKSRELQENATGAPLPSLLAKQEEAATSGNKKNTAQTLEGQVDHGVWVLMDITFAAETALNLGSDFGMEYVLMSQAFDFAGETISPAARKTIFKYSLIWKCCSTGLCYVASLVVAYLRSKDALWTAFRQKQQEKYGEPYSGMKVTLYFALTYTTIAAVKAAVLFGMYRFYRNFDTLVAQSSGQAYNFQQGFPSIDGGVAPGTYPPYATADPGTAAASYPPYPAAAPGTAAAASYPPYPAAAPGTAAAASYPPYPTAGSGTAPGSNPPYPAFAPETARSSYPPYPVAGS